MDFSLVDELFDIYKNEDFHYAKDMFIKYYKKYGRENLFSILNEYIQQQTKGVASFFKSNKDEVNAEHNLVRDIVSAFDNLIMSVDFVLLDILNLEENDDYEHEIHVKPHDFFRINIDLIERAVKTYADCYMDDFNKIKDLIVYVKQNKILKKLYRDDSWYELDFEELMYNIYDYVEDKSIFKKDVIPTYRMDAFLFEKIKTNCGEMLSSSFEKFRPNLNSTKQIRANFGKLIFCRNLMSFYDTQIMPDYNGFIDFSADYFEHLNLIDDFKRLYSRKFDEETFREQQGNFICNPEIYSTNYKFEIGKKVRKGDKLIVGFIVSCLDGSGSIQNHYLIHIAIDDVNNQLSNYEMQINIIPHGELKNRLQLMRLDNWASEQSHRNIATKLSTTTHVHLYNEFDLLRGKTNGAFDIMYNLDGEGVKFETSLKRFLAILDFNDDISKSIYALTMEDVGYDVTTETEIKIWKS